MKMDYPLSILLRMLSDNQEQEGCTTRELVGLRACACVCVSDVKFSHPQRPIHSSNKAVMM